ncbi:MAG: hypothetical protein EA362_10305 [Saprospirales bacterium]|nr:MAG: hypothetical protein EA362_10305 [Saprospirales bacterium]
MNMLTSDKIAILVLMIFSLQIFSSCTVEDNYIYEIKEQTILPVNSEKDKDKSNVQYISILYTNLFRKAMSPNDMLDALRAIESIGDKQIAFDILVSKYMNSDEVVLPTEEEMREDPEKFIRDTYKRFFVRQPTQAELTWMINYINSRPEVNPEHFYFAFATSNEHFHY